MALAAFLAPVADAQQTGAEATKLTEINLSGPIQVPGVTLPAGTYTFQTPEPGDHVVQIFNKDRSKLLATVMTIPEERLKPTDKTVIMFAEQPAGVPEAVKAWFYPGNPVGEEFIYPKPQAVEIAKAYRTSVLASEGEKVEKGGKTTRVDETGAVGTSGTSGR
jgi:hypothetical protein